MVGVMEYTGITSVCPHHRGNPAVGTVSMLTFALTVSGLVVKYIYVRTHANASVQLNHWHDCQPIKDAQPQWSQNSQDSQQSSGMTPCLVGSDKLTDKLKQSMGDADYS